MSNIIFAAYTWLDVNDPRYDDNPRWIRADTLKAMTRLLHTLKRYTDEDVTTVSIYPSRGKVNIKLRIPEDFSQRNVVKDVHDKEGIYETVLGMVMDGRKKG